MAESQHHSKQPLHAVIMGVAGCGKTTVGKGLAVRLHAEFIDGDDLHPQSNVDKMASGVPLVDEDRWPWLDLIGQSFSGTEAALLIGCSALKRCYRDRIRRLARSPIEFIHLSGDRTILEQRLAMRQGHFMKPQMIDSQFRDLQPLGSDEAGLVVDINQPVEQVLEYISGHYLKE